MSALQLVALNQFKNLIQPPVASVHFEHGTEASDKVLKMHFHHADDAEAYIRNIKNFHQINLVKDSIDQTGRTVLLPEQAANQIYNRSLINMVKHELMMLEKGAKK